MENMYKLRGVRGESKQFLSRILTSEQFTYTCNSLGLDCAAVTELHLRDEMKVVFMKNSSDPSAGTVTAGFFILSSRPAEIAMQKPGFVGMKGFAAYFVITDGLCKGNIWGWWLQKLIPALVSDAGLTDIS